MEDHLYEHMCANIKHYLEKEKATYAHLDQAAGLSGSVVRRLMLGFNKNPTLWTLEKISSAMGITVGALLACDEKPKEQTVQQLQLDLIQAVFQFLLSKTEGKPASMENINFTLAKEICDACTIIKNGVFDWALAEYAYTNAMKAKR